MTTLVLRDAQTQEHEERDKLLETFTRWRDQNTQLELPQDLWLDIRRALAAYHIPADWSPVRNQVDECVRIRESNLRAQLLQAENILNALLEEQKEWERELKQLKAQPEPIPPRRDQIQATRLQLMLRGIPCAPLYELVDFAPDLSQKERDLLEAQLTDTGLLDALVVPEEQLPAIQELLEQERSRMPEAEELDQALALLDQAHRELRQAEEDQQSKRAVEQAAKQAWSALEEKTVSLSAGLPYERTVPDYEEAQEAAAGYQDTLNDLEHSRQKLDYALRAMDDEQNTIDEQRDHVADQRKANEAVQRSLQVSQSSAKELQAYLDRPENQARVRRLMELDQEIDHQNQENRSAEKACVRLETELENSAEAITRRKENLLNATIDEQDTECYFREDLELGFSGLDETLDLEERARQAVSKIQPADRNYTPEHMADALRSNYQRLNNSLLSYHPEIKLVFDAPNQPAHLRQRLSILLRKGGKELSLYNFIQSLQTDIDSTGRILEDRDRELFENILTETIVSCGNC